MTNTTMLIAKQRLEEIVSFFGANVAVDVEETEDGLELSIAATRISPRLIGHRGETLRSLEYILNQMVKHIDAEAPRVIVDIAGYKENRKKTLAQLAQDVAGRVKDSGEEEELKPMNPAERRIVHMTLRTIEGVDSESRGEGRGRRIVVKPSA
jgi:spoIIIJ-associated protein